MKTHIRQHICDELVLASVLISAAQRPTCVHVHMHVAEDVLLINLHDSVLKHL